MAESKSAGGSATSEAWAQWTDAMRTWFSQPANLNPFQGLVGMPTGDQSANQAADWMRLIDPESIGRRIEELRVVESWMRMSLAGIEATIRTLEMQRDAYASLARGRDAVHNAAQSAAQSMVDAVATATAAAHEAARSGMFANVSATPMAGDSTPSAEDTGRVRKATARRSTPSSARKAARRRSG